jgi:predicted RNA polymerase sigma factor
LFKCSFCTVEHPALRHFRQLITPIKRRQQTVGQAAADGFDAGCAAKSEEPGPQQLATVDGWVQHGADGRPGAAVHDEAAGAEETDWPQIEALYGMLLRISGNPMVALNHAVAVAMARGPRAGLDLLGKLETDVRIAEDHRLHAVRAHLLEMAGEHAAARESYEAAARRTTSIPRQRYLHRQAARLTPDSS